MAEEEGKVQEGKGRAVANVGREEEGEGGGGATLVRCRRSSKVWMVARAFLSGV